MTAAITATRNFLVRSNRGEYDCQLSRCARLGAAAEDDPQLNAWLSYLDDTLIYGSDADSMAAYGELCIIYARLGWEWPVPLPHRQLTSAAISLEMVKPIPVPTSSPPRM